MIMDVHEPVDCLIVGAGPAGLTAALYLRRFHRRVLVVDSGDGRAMRIRCSHNVPGFPQGIAGPALIGRMLRQLSDVHGRVTAGRVTHLAAHPVAGFMATVEGADAPAGVHQVRATTVLLATGALDHEPGVPGLQDVRAQGLLRACPICDGFEFTGRRIGVLGSGAHGARESLFIRHFSERVFLYTVQGEQEIDAKLQATLQAGNVHRLAGRLREVAPASGAGVRIVMDEGLEHYVDVLYVAMGCHPRGELAALLDAPRDPSGNLTVDAHCCTGIAGLYAAGDVTNGLDQIVVAAGQAAIAATAIHNSLDAGTSEQNG